MTWVPHIDYEGHTDPGTLRVVETPWRWVLLVALGCWLCGRHRGLRWLPHGRFGYWLLRWADQHGEAVSVEVFHVPFTPEVSAQVAEAIEQHEASA